MGFTKGVNCGFVETAPTADPNGTGGGTMDTRAYASKDTSPATATKVTEIGWWCDNATEDADTDVAIYSHDTTNNKPDAKVGGATFAKGTTAGWKTVAVDITITPNTLYWIAVQLDDTATTTQHNYLNLGGYLTHYQLTVTELAAPWGTSTGYFEAFHGVYAVWEAGSAGTNSKINIADAWKEINAMKINIADAWKEITSIKINIADAWKTIT